MANFAVLLYMIAKKNAFWFYQIDYSQIIDYSQFAPKCPQNVKTSLNHSLALNKCCSSCMFHTELSLQHPPPLEKKGKSRQMPR